MFRVRRSQLIRSAVLALLYALVSVTAFASAYFLRFDGAIPRDYEAQMLAWIGWVVAVQVGVLVVAGQVNVLPTYFSLMDLRSVVIANVISSGLLMLATTVVALRLPLGVAIIDFVLLSGGICASRALLRHWGDRRRARRMAENLEPGSELPTAIVGAGDAGAALARELINKPSLRLKPVAFFDDNPMKWDQRLHGIPIIGKPELLREPQWRRQIRKVIMAMPTAKASRIGEVARIAAEIGVPSDTIPALDQLVAGHVKVSQLRPLQIEDLLRREPINLDMAGIRQIIRDQIIAVTGAGGSIGSELCRQILAQKPRQLLLIERSEVQLFQIEQELIAAGGNHVVVPLVADVCDVDRVREILGRYRPDAIFHAAAHKHVPMMEGQPGEAIRNNSFGTANLARLAHETGVGRFVLISTDKAINPTNVMGASKRLAEVFLQAFQANNRGRTLFMAVRFGNVLGSSGSVVPTFQKQIAAGGPVTVTDPNVTRYFMTIPEAVGLVLQAGALGRGGEIFVLDMGEPVKIVDLARQMIELSGYRAGVDIEIRFTGLRPGEKLYEELSHHREQLTETGHGKIFRFVCSPNPLSKVEEFFDRIEPMLNNAGHAEIKQALVEMVPEYKPFVEASSRSSAPAPRRSESPILAVAQNV